MLAVSAAAGATWIASEGFSPVPYVPTQGDVPTIGHGSTHYEDGTRVKMTDPPISRQRARELALGELDNTYGQCVRDGLGDTLVSQIEFDLAADFTGQYGCGAFKASSIRSKTVTGDYVGACKGYLAYKLMNAGRNGPGPGLVLVRGVWKQDCSYPGNKICSGVWTRQLKRFDACMAAQSVPAEELIASASTDIAPSSTESAPPSIDIAPSSTPEPQPVKSPWWLRAWGWLAFWKR